jgi:F420-dependent oxidoreductase-like protein
LQREETTVELGLMTGYWGAGPPPGAPDAVRTAEELGFDSVWTAEAYGSDALTPLAWWGAQTTRVRLGTAIMQMSARTPAATAMAAITMDHLSGGRFILGLGVSGPQVVEGWYGMPYPKPLARTREYVAIVRRILARDEPVVFAGEHYRLPYAGGTGLGKALKSTVHPRRPDLPIMLAAEGPKNVALAAEIADGWIPFWFSPKSDRFYREALAEGFARSGARRTGDTFEVPCPVPVVVNDDVEAAADVVRPLLALYVGGMGAKSANFHYEVLARLGYDEQCRRIQELYLSGDRAAAIAAVPTAMVEDVALVGPAAKIREELPRWEATVITTMLVSGPPDLLRLVASLAA